MALRVDLTGERGGVRVDVTGERVRVEVTGECGED